MIRRSTIVLSLFFTVAFLMINQSMVHTNSTMPPVARTGAPGETTCGVTGCHNTNAIMDFQKLDINFIPTNTSGYVPGQVYNLSITINDGNAVVGGFALTTIDASGLPAGTLQVTNTNNTALQTGGPNNREYISHNNATGTIAWAFRWTAPATDIGPVYFHAAGNAANGNAQSTGDIIFQSVMTVTTSGVFDGFPTGIDQKEFDFISGLKIGPNPVVKSIRLNYQLEEAGNVAIEMLDISGRELEKLYEEQQFKGEYNIQLALNNTYPAGIYFLRINKDGESTDLKKVVLR